MNESHWMPHPWHGLTTGEAAPEVVRVYLEVTPFDSIKYEIDKTSGHLRVDRPQEFSSLPPTPYGFLPRTLCAQRVARLMPGASRADGDPLDVCVMSERPITRSGVLLDARVVGGLPMLDNGEADDKLIAVLEGDHVWGGVLEIDELPPALVARLRHYFQTYKGAHGSRVSVGDPYDAAHAQSVVSAAMDDYVDAFS